MCIHIYVWLIYDSQMSFNLLAIFLNQNKLTRPNYVDWKRNPDTVLTTEGYKYVLIEELPDLSTANAFILEREIYENWDGTLLYFSFDVFNFITSSKRLFKCYGYDPKPQRDIWGTRATC